MQANMDFRGGQDTFKRVALKKVLSDARKGNREIC